MRSSDTSELFFEDIRLSADCLLGEEGAGFAYMMDQLPQERLAIAVAAQAGAQRAFDEAITYTKSRKAFGQAVFDFQNTRFVLAGRSEEHTSELQSLMRISLAVLCLQKKNQ